MFEKNLFGLEKNGDVKVWSITVWVASDGRSVITINHGKEGGKLTRKDEFVMVGKQGRTTYEQAVSQAEGRIKKQLDKNYRPTKEELTDVPLLPMLASDYNKVGSRIKWEDGVNVPDKFDGVRCLVKCAIGGGITLESRTGQPYNIPHIVAELEKIMQPGDVLDAEIYLHGYVLQDITSSVKRTDTQKNIDDADLKVSKVLQKFGRGVQLDDAKSQLAEALEIAEIRPQLQLHVFDMPSDKPWYQRLVDLNIYARDRFFGDFIILTENPIVFSEEEMKVLHKDAVRRGYEGVMLRNKMGMYESGKRSADLQKYKEFVDEEFKILDILPAKDEGSVYLLKNNLNDLKFTCTMGDMAARAKSLAEKELYISKFMNLKFQSRYKGTLLPQFGVGQYIRDGYLVEGTFIPYD